MKIFTRPAGGLGTNCYMILSEDEREAAIIDAAGFVPEYAEKLAALGAELKYLILTHGHVDHIGGVQTFQQIFPQAELVAGAREAALLSDPSLNLSQEVFRDPLILTPDKLVSEGDELVVGDAVMRVIETPGHTAGGISLLVNGEVLFSGDTLFRASIGRTDLPTGDYATLIQSIREKLLTLADEVRVLPGHMQETTIGFERINNQFLV